MIRSKRAYGCTIILYGAAWWTWSARVIETGEYFSSTIPFNKDLPGHRTKREVLRLATNAAKAYHERKRHGG